jgi:nicotinate-nucleotide adenylyltransferase
MKRVGLYFGSFNPVHTGHIHLAKYLTDNNLVDEVWFVISLEESPETTITGISK